MNKNWTALPRGRAFQYQSGLIGSYTTFSTLIQQCVTIWHNAVNPSSSLIKFTSDSEPGPRAPLPSPHTSKHGSSIPRLQSPHIGPFPVRGCFLVWLRGCSRAAWPAASIHTLHRLSYRRCSSVWTAGCLLRASVSEASFWPKPRSPVSQQKGRVCKTSRAPPKAPSARAKPTGCPIKSSWSKTGSYPASTHRPGPKITTF